MNRTQPILVATTALLLMRPSLAHHSFAMFDQQKQLTLMGTVKDFQWTNPHCWIQIWVPNGDGTEEWGVEMDNPRVLFRGGWKPGTLKPGDKVTVVIHPLLDGKSGGSFISAIGPDGQSLGKQP